MVKDNKERGSAFRMYGNWKLQSELLRLAFPALSNTDLAYERGKEKELLRRIERKLDKNRDEIIEIIKKVQPIKSKDQLKEWVVLEFIEAEGNVKDKI